MNPPVAPNPLNDVERLTLLDTIDALELISTADELVICIRDRAQSVIPHEGLICGIGNIADENVRPYRMVEYNFPRAYIDHIRQGDGGLNSPVMARWRASRAPVLIDLDDGLPDAPIEWLTTARRLGIRNFAAHGLIDLQGALTSYFCFINSPVPPGEKHLYALKRLVPHMHVALLRAASTMEDMRRGSKLAVGPVHLTPRQKNILSLLRAGKTNREIAEAMKMTDGNIKYHIGRIFSQLNASNRTEAVAKALVLRIIEP